MESTCCVSGVTTDNIRNDVVEYLDHRLALELVGLVGYSLSWSDWPVIV